MRKAKIVFGGDGPAVLAGEALSTSINDDSVVGGHAKFLSDCGEVLKEIWPCGHS